MDNENPTAPGFDWLGARPRTLARVYLNVTTGKRYAAVIESGGIVELEPLSGPCIYARIERLADANLWRRIN